MILVVKSGEDSELNLEKVGVELNLTVAQVDSSKSIKLSLPFS